MYEARKSSGPDQDVAAGIAGHMGALAHEFVGSFFVTVAIHGKEGDSLRHALAISDLPAFVCLRRCACSCLRLVTGVGGMWAPPVSCHRVICH